MSMLTQVDSMTAWLRDQRHRVELQLEMMASRFDLDGALAADQTGMAWMARRALLVTALELHLSRRGRPAPAGADFPDRVCLLMADLGRIDGDLARDLWGELERHAPLEPGRTADEIERTIAFMTSRLAVREAGSRDAAVRDWADAIRVLREVAKGLGIAQTDDWYLHEAEPDQQLDWYDEVMRVLADEGAQSR